MSEKEIEDNISASFLPPKAAGTTPILQASEDRNPAQHEKEYAFAKSHPLISVAFSTPMPDFVNNPAVRF